MNVKFNDLKKQYNEIKTEIDLAISSVIEETAFVRGKYVKAFEENYKESYGVKNCVSCANGTDAIYLTLKALGIGPGDEVITTAVSWIATSETISLTGAKVVFVDIEENYFCIDTKKIEEKITSATKAIIPVHLYGQIADMESIRKICEKHNLYLIEDCAQAHFAEQNGVKAGLFGDAGTFSFYPGKNLGAYGDAGAVITNNSDLAKKVRMVANHGSIIKHDHEIEGINSRMDGLQAAILSVKLKYIDEWTKKRQVLANHYYELLNDCNQLELPQIRTNNIHVYHLFVIRTKERDTLADYLKSKNISTGIHYPKALPFLKAYEHYQFTSKDFPIAYRYQNEILSLPLYPEMDIKEIEVVCKEIKSFFE